MLLTLALTSALATTPAAPLRVDLFETRLDRSVGLLVPELAKGSLGGGISNIVAGSILTVVGGAIMVGGIYSLVGAANATGNSQTVFTVLGWTFTGFGGLLALVGVPLLVVGIVRVATWRPARADRISVGVGSNGQLALSF